MMKASHIVNTIFSSRTYILSGDKSEFWIVDCGDVEPLMERLSAVGGKDYRIKGVLLTHAHFDHIYGLPRLTELFPGVKVYTNDFGRRTLADDKMNLSRYQGDRINYDSDHVVVVDEGAEIELFDGVVAKVYWTPGHHPSCLTFEVGDYLFTGDAFIPGCDVVTNLPGGDRKLAAQSVERIRCLAEGKVICGGHEMEGAGVALGGWL